MSTPPDSQDPMAPRPMPAGQPASWTKPAQTQVPDAVASSQPPTQEPAPPQLTEEVAAELARLTQNAQAACARLEQAVQVSAALVSRMESVDAAGAPNEAPLAVADVQKEIQEAQAALAAPHVVPGPILEALADAEQTLVDLDATMPPQWFLANLVMDALTPVALAHYARMLISQSTPDRWALVRPIITPLVRVPDQDVLKPYPEVAAILDVLALRTEITLETHVAASKFFKAARQRLDATPTLDALFEGGFIVDVEGYRISLRKELFQPELLYDSLELDVLFARRLKELTAAANAQPEAVQQRVWEARNKVAQIFKIARAEETLPTRFVRKKKKVKYVPGQSSAPIFSAPRQRSQTLKYVVYGALLLGGGGYSVAMFMEEEKTNLAPVEPAALTQLWPLLISGSYSLDSVNRVFMGKVDPARWSVLSASQRRKEGRKLRSQLLRENVQGALVFVDDTMVLRIEGGHVKFVQ